MRVALINPRGAGNTNHKDMVNHLVEAVSGEMVFVNVDEVEFMPSLGLLTMAAFFDPGWEVIYLDENHVDPVDAEERLFGNHFDLACITALNHQARRAYELADRFRDRKVPVVIGGLHASALPWEASHHADAVVVGEGEDVFPELLGDFCRDPSLCQGQLHRFYRSSGEVELYTVPAPLHHLAAVHPTYNKVPLQATRGCPHSCSFCCLREVYGSRFRHKTVTQVVNEVKAVRALYPGRYLSFTDENMLIDRGFARELLEALIPLEVEFECYSDVSVADDPSLLDSLARAGCREILIGFESLNPGSLRDSARWKYGRFEGYARAVEAIQAHGIGIWGLFVVGFDKDDSTTFARILDFAQRTNLYAMDISILTPIPGTPLYHQLKAQGRLLSENWEDYTWHRVNFTPLQMSPKELRDGVYWLYREYYKSELVVRRAAHFGRPPAWPRSFRPGSPPANLPDSPAPATVGAHYGPAGEG